MNGTIPLHETASRVLETMHARPGPRTATEVAEFSDVALGTIHALFANEMADLVEAVGATHWRLRSAVRVHVPHDSMVR